MEKIQTPPKKNMNSVVQTAIPVSSAKEISLTITQAPQEKNIQSSFWPVLPSLLWLIMVIVLLLVFGKKIEQLLAELILRLRLGAAVKVASFEIGPIVVSPGHGQDISKQEKQIGVRPDNKRYRENERRDYRNRVRDIMLVHRLYRSRKNGQLYDLVIYVIPHKKGSLAEVTRVEYFLGSYWGNKIFPSIDRSRGFAIATAAYGPMLCTAEVFFNDGTNIMLHRYLDFEMGASAPTLLSTKTAVAADGEPDHPPREFG